MKKISFFLSLFLIINFVSNAQNSDNNSIKLLTQKKGVSIRGLSIPESNIIWASGSKGTVALSINKIGRAHV